MMILQVILMVVQETWMMIPDSTLKKKNHAIAYHFFREGVAREEWVTGYVKSENNAADPPTKTIPAGERRDRLGGH